ncbi:MAG: phenylalanine--tRNA ligase beta subunit-related protein [Firmicutes bacterium]|nr:phenylalanine--tRNA ligase beta subunit-related protein [Bacillota bacterium]
MKFSINAKVFEIAPTMKIGVLELSGINNKADVGKFFDTELALITKDLAKKFDGVELAEYPLVKSWREIYKKFGEKKARSSIEALIRRIVGGKGLYRINALVDLYNLASLRFELPAGGEDTDMMKAPLELTIAEGTEEFLPLGGGVENPNNGEVIYKSGDIVVCRNFNYRESDITKLTENTKNAVIVFEDVFGSEEELNKAMDWLAEKAKTFLGADVKSRFVYKEGE